MESLRKLRIVLFALTGFGNKVLGALLQDKRVIVEAVFTVKYESPFPYYEEKQLLDFCTEQHIPCYFNVKVNSEEGMELLRYHKPDLIFISTFKQIIKRNVLDLPTLGVVNFHPSLLPYYRGPCPTNAVLLNGESYTGVKAHYVTEELDRGNILLQRKIAITKTDHDGVLRLKLAELAGQMVPDVIELFQGFNQPVGSAQADNISSYAPKPTSEDGFLESAPDISTVVRIIRAYNPFPGTSLLVRERRVAVDQYEVLTEEGRDGIFEYADFIDFFLNKKGIRLYKKGDSN